MSPGPVLALRTAILAAVGADSVLAGQLGGAPVVHDEPPRGSPPVYAAFGRVVARDASSEGVKAHAQELEIAVWAKPGSAATGLAVADRLATLLDDASLVLDGHRLIALRVAETGAVRDSGSGSARAWLRLAALTETLD